MAFIKVKSGGIWGIEGYQIDVEVDISPGIPSFNIVGLPDTAIKESKERVRSAIKNLGFEFPQRKITVNLSPSHIRKQGTMYDLPVAVGILALSGKVPKRNLQDFIFLGELSLDGKVNRVNGVLPIVVSLSREGAKKFVVPLPNTPEGSFIEDCDVYGVSSLGEVVDFLTGKKELESKKITIGELSKRDRNEGIDLSDVVGQSLAKRGLEVSAAGGHNMSMVGAPGSGKSMIARRITTILPPLTFEEALEVSRIYSVAGELEDGLITTRPFRAPHHTASEVSIIGGGTIPQPGEISLAHLGVLFLDELPEFARKTLEVLRQPLEDGYINISRAQGKVRFPARFTLITAQNPCPCGNYGNPYRECTCSPAQIRTYNSRISQPIKDRIDIRVWVDPVEKEDLIKQSKGESSREVRERVTRAFEIQKERFKDSGTDLNGRMTNQEVEQHCLALLEEGAKRLLDSAIEKFRLSGRGYYRVLKVARTIADLEESEPIKTHHLAQALQFRASEREGL